MADTKLNKDTLLPLGVVIVVITAVAGGAVWLNSKLQSINYHMEKLNIEVTNIKKQLDLAEQDHWTYREMRLWVELLKAKNTGIDVPNIDR